MGDPRGLGYPFGPGRRAQGEPSPR
jgi:hypothetical protein